VQLPSLEAHLKIHEIFHKNILFHIFLGGNFTF
jgi:hypothetical protein